MARQTRVTRKWGSIQFVPGSTETLDLPMGLDLESIQCYIAGNITIGTAYTGIRTEGLSKLVKNIAIVANGETLGEISGEMLVHGNFARPGGVVKINPAYALGATTGEAVGFVDFDHIGGMRPKDSILRTVGFRSLQLRVTWGQWSDMYVGAGAVTAHDIHMDVALRETADHGATEAPQLRRQYRKAEKAYTVSMEDRIALDPNMLYRAIVLRTESGGELSAAVLNGAKVVLGSDTVFELSALQIDDFNEQDYGFPLVDGYYVIDFAPAPNGQSKVADFLDTNGRMGDAFLVLNVNGGATNKVQILSHQFQVMHEAVQAAKANARAA